eukprot:343432-Chlamydomonas_euryale.AAC.1
MGRRTVRTNHRGAHRQVPAVDRDPRCVPGQVLEPEHARLRVAGLRLWCDRPNLHKAKAEAEHRLDDLRVLVKASRKACAGGNGCVRERGMAGWTR